jgi:Ni2+-binding GTPase involved in maturation of urease and hydrogenase
MSVITIERSSGEERRDRRTESQVFERHGLFVFSLVSSPGAGKTTLLERTIQHLDGSLKLAVIEGDDKPLKYPGMVRNATVLVINKVDLAPTSTATLPCCVRTHCK